MEAIAVGHIGEAIERTAVGGGDEHAVVAGVREARSQASKRRPVDAVGLVCRTADRQAVEAGAIQGVAVDEPDAYQTYTRISRGKAQDRENQQCYRGKARAPTSSHALLLVLHAPSVERHERRGQHRALQQRASRQAIHGESSPAGTARR